VEQVSDSSYRGVACVIDSSYGGAAHLSTPTLVALHVPLRL
jgi:hypothetical protein